MTADEEIARGNRAQQLLDDPLLKESLAMIEADAMQRWRDAPARDTEGREILWLTVKVLGLFRGQLEAVVSTGKIAASNVAETERLRKQPA